MRNSESVESWDFVSPELRQSLSDSGIYLPGSEEWTRISEDLGPSTTTNHIFNVITLPAAESYSETFANFALEIVQSIPESDFRMYVRHDKLKDLSDAKLRQLLKSWIGRWRIFRFERKVAAEDLATLRGFVDKHAPLPFIDILWYRGRMIDISIRELLEVDAWR